MSNILIGKVCKLGACLGMVAGSLLMTGVIHATETEVDPTPPAADNSDFSTSEEESGEEATTSDPAVDETRGDSGPDASLPDAGDAGFGDGGEAMPGVGTEPPEERSGEPLLEEDGRAGDGAN